MFSVNILKFKRKRSMITSLAIVALVLILVFALTGCKFATPFSGPITQMNNLSPDSTAVIALTYVKTGDDSTKNVLFWEQVMKVNTSLQNMDGYLGHSIRRIPLGREGWTMTVWENEDYLNAFVRSDSHKTAMAIGLVAVNKARFARLTVKRNEIPISWDRAEQVLLEHGRDLY